MENKTVRLELTVKGHPHLPEITRHEVGELILSMELYINRNRKRRIHLSYDEKTGELVDNSTVVADTCSNWTADPDSGK